MQMILKPYVYRENISSTTESLEKASYLNFSVTILCRLMKTCHLLLSTNENVLVNIGTGQIQNSGSKKILGIKIDYKLNFKDTRKHIQKIKRKIKCFDQGLRLLES